MINVEIQFRHNLKNNYLIMKNSNIAVNDYRIKMLLKNDIEGFLKFSISCVDGDIELSYRISSKQSVKNLYEGQKLRYDDLFNIIKGVIDIADKAHRYLLKIDDILLEPEFIYMDYACNKIWFCYYPNSGNDFKMGVKKLIQEFILVTEHGDRKAVGFIYGIYDICGRTDFLMDDIEMFMSEYKGNHDYIEDSSIPYYNEEAQEKNGMTIVCENSEAAVKINDEIYDREMRDIIKNIGFIKKISEVFHFPEISKFRKNNNNAYKKDIQRNVKFDEYVSSADSESDNYKTEDNCETILLSERLPDTKRILFSVSNQNDIEISTYPFVIGKLMDKTDYVLNDRVISRIHMKIDIDEENNLYVEDLNSKNGTFINGIRLEPYEKKWIKTGDRITIATFDYFFR